MPTRAHIIGRPSNNRRSLRLPWIPASIALLSLPLAACGAAPQPATRDPIPQGAASAALPAETPKGRPVVIAVVIDQLPAWLAEERLSTLPTTGGFARLRREGLSVRELKYLHAVTDTAPGHAALFTGATPRESGITANERLDEKGERVSILSDRSASTVGPTGRVARVSSSLRALNVETVADGLRVAHPDAIIVSLSLKDRGALFGGGRAPNATLWLDLDAATWTTSTAIKKDDTWFSWAPLPELAHPWTPRDAAWLASRVRVRDDAPGEGDFYGLGTAFPHTVPTGAKAGRAFRGTPMADAWTVETAERALDAYVRPNETAPVLLSVSFSANDYIGHAYGPDSWEAWDELYRLDALLAAWMTSLDRRFGERGYAMVVAADHGGISLPESPSRARCEDDRWDRPCASGPRVDPNALQEMLERALKKELGAGPWILGIADPFVWLRPRASETATRRAAVIASVKRTLEKQPWFERAVDVRSEVASCEVASATDESLRELICASLARTADSTGDILVLMKRGAFFDIDYTPGKGTNHGTPWRYDRTVPMFVRAPGRVLPGARVEALSFRAYARTLTDLLGIPPLETTRNEPSIAAGARRTAK